MIGKDIAQKSLTPKQLSLITYNPKPLSKPDTHHVVFGRNEKNIRMLQLFNKGLKQLKESGKFDQYFEESRRGEYKKK